MKFTVVALALFTLYGCSLAALRIIGGHIAKTGYYPFFVRLQYKSTDECGGTLINGRFVLTAFHCVQNDSVAEHYRIWYNVTNRCSSEGYKSVGVKRIFTCPGAVVNLSDNVIKNDLALLELDESPKIANHPSVRLPRRHEKVIHIGREGVTIGMGMTSWNGTASCHLKELQQRVIKSKKPSQSLLLGCGYEDGFCALALELGASACYGDSGSPWLVREKNGNYIVAGLTSYGDKCRWKYGDSFAEVDTDEHLAWIQKIIRKSENL